MPKVDPLDALISFPLQPETTLEVKLWQMGNGVDGRFSMLTGKISQLDFQNFVNQALDNAVDDVLDNSVLHWMMQHTVLDDVKHTESALEQWARGYWEYKRAIRAFHRGEREHAWARIAASNYHYGFEDGVYEASGRKIGEAKRASSGGSEKAEAEGRNLVKAALIIQMRNAIAAGDFWTSAEAAAKYLYPDVEKFHQSISAGFEFTEGTVIGWLRNDKFVKKVFADGKKRANSAKRPD